MKFGWLKSVGKAVVKAAKWVIAHPDTVKDVVDVVKDCTDKDGK